MEQFIKFDIKPKSQDFFKNGIDESYNDLTITIYADSLEEIIDRVNSIKEYYNRERIIEEIRESHYYDYKWVDKDGNEVDYMDIVEDDVDNSIFMVDYTEDELKEIIDHETAIFDNFFRVVESGNYQYDIVYLSNVFENKQEAITYFANKSNVIILTEFNLDDLYNILNNIEVSDNTKFITKYNYDDTCTKKEILDLLKYMLDIAKYIKRFDLSPLEICIFVNDLVREREYKDIDNKILEISSLDEIADIKEKSSYSRSLMKIYNSDKIVCVGFAKLYNSILELVGIKTEEVFWRPTDNSNSGHMSSLVYLDDPKYNISGVYETDPTWGRILNADDTYNYQKSILNYFYFFRTINEACKIKKHYNQELQPVSIFYYKLIELMKRYKELTNLGAPFSLTKKWLEVILVNLIKVNKIINNAKYDELILNVKELLDNKDNESLEYKMNLLSDIDKVVFNTPLPIISFEDALLRVKLVEHSIDKDKYPISIELLEKARLSRNKENEQARTLASIFGIPLGYVFDEDDDLQIARMELISALHKVAEDGVDNNPTIYKK